MLESARLSNADIVYALEHNSEFFINFFLAEEVKVPVPQFHSELMDLMVHTDVPQLSLAVPRAHAKTTLAQLSAIHHLLFTDFSYVLYMSSTSGHSIPCVNDIIDWLESDNFIQVFGTCAFHTRQEGKGFYEFTLPNGKYCILKAFGAGQKVRGTKIKKKRPQLVIVDDLEDNDNIGTPELFQALKRWVYGPFKKCTDPFLNKWIWIGNMIQQQSMLFENHKSQFWYSVLYGCLLENGTPLWPDLWPIAALRKDFAEYQENGMADVWFAEMMNMPMAGINGGIEAEDITYLPALVERESEFGFLTIDLAISDKDWAHQTVIAVHAWVPELDVWQIAETHAYTGIDPIALFREVIVVGSRWGFGVVGIESVAYQAALQPVFEHLALMENISGFTFVQVPARARKRERILTWFGMLKDGTYCLTEHDFVTTQQALAYDLSKKENEDDIIDACAHGVKVIAEYSFEIWNQKLLEKEEPHAIQNGYQISRV